MICDLERHQVLDLLPERSAPSVAQWLQAHPSVEIVCRDRSRLYAEGIRQGPHRRSRSSIGSIWCRI
jgi:transposase